MNIALLGPQGSGKGTQGEMLSKKTGMYYFDAGSYLRQLAKTRPDIDEMVNKKGILMPDEMVYKLVRDYFIEKKQFDNIIFDGYPRSLIQWNLLNSFLSTHSSAVSKVFFLNIPEEETVRRLSARRMDPATGHIYNLVTNPPPSTVDINSLSHREDDKPDAIRRRLSQYHSQTEPLIEAIEKEGKLIRIDGLLAIEEIQNQILQKLN